MEGDGADRPDDPKANAMYGIEADGVRVTVETMHRTRILQVLARLPAPDTRPAQSDVPPMPDTDARKGGEP